MNNENGINTIPCTVNGLKLKFILDTGATNVYISLSEANFMLRNDYLNKGDIIGISANIIANGGIIENTQIILNEIEIGGLKLKNVKANVIHDMNAPLLLGKSIIERLGKVQLNGDELIISDKITPSSILNKDISKLLDQAWKYYKDSFMQLAIDTYKRAYCIAPDSFNVGDYYGMGHAYYFVEYNTDNHVQSVKYLEKAIETLEDRYVFEVYQAMADAYRENGNYSESLIISQKMLSRGKDEWMTDDEFAKEKHNIYVSMGRTYYYMKEYLRARHSHIEAIKLYIKAHSVKSPVRYENNDNPKLGILYGFLADCFYAEDMIISGRQYLSIATLYGDENARNRCIQNNINWNYYWEFGKDAFDFSGVE